MDNSSIISNKIITADDLRDIFKSMANVLDSLQKAYDTEEQNNQQFLYQYQVRNIDNYNSRFSGTIYFTDRTSVNYDSYSSFMRDFDNRCGSIERLYVDCSVSYFSHNNGQPDAHHHSAITMSVSTDSLRLNTNFGHDEHSLDDVYQLIQQKIASAPDKYDRVVKSRGLITAKVGFAIVSIPIALLMACLVLMPTMRQIYAGTIVAYPLIVLCISAILGSVIGTSMTERDYQPIQPRQKYDRYDTKNHQSVYTDDVTSYTETGEVQIGKNLRNDRHRRNIIRLEQRYSKLLIPELIVITVLSLTVLAISIIWK